MGDEALKVEFDDGEELEPTGAPEQAPEEDEGEPRAEDQPEGDEPEGDEPETEEERVRFDEKQQAVLDREIAKRVKSQREAEREAEKLRQELEEVRSKLPQDQRPEIPEIPDPWDENYNEKIKARDEAILNQARWDARNQYQQEREEQIVEQQNQARIQQITSAQQSYNERVKTIGIDQAELQQATNTVAQFNVPFELIEYVLNDDMGPAITLHLGNNIQDLERVRGMSPVMAAAYIAGEIKPKLKPRDKRPRAPEPTETVRGGGAAPKRGPKGAVYE